jgi:hypothetical protein
VAACLTAALPASAQYPGQITKKDKDVPALRAVAVLEWTGDLARPKTSRLVPITVYDGEQLQDAAVYLARPQPLAVVGGTEYILQKDGARIGLFDVQSAGQDQGSWIGFGRWKPMETPRTKVPVQKIDEDVNDSDRPVLHRKHGSSGGGSGGSGGDSSASAPPPDPDRPTLHKSPSSQSGSGDPASESGSSSGSGSGPASGSGSGTASSQGSSQTQSSSTSTDPDRPALKRGKQKQQEADEGYVESLPGVTDPDRPRLARGKSTGGVAGDMTPTPTLVGLPPGMEQTVAVSDPRNTKEHPWSYSWADPDDEGKMKAALEDSARAALGLNPPPAPAHKPTTAAARAKAKAAPPAEPGPLMDEEVRVFELAYGSGATLVLTAHTDAPPAQQKFVTLIAQPDLYGGLIVLFKSVTDAAHLDDKPRMRLVDAVDALADNRGELLFELRGRTQRQFALYRVLRGTAKELFVTGGGASSPEAVN